MYDRLISQQFRQLFGQSVISSGMLPLEIHFIVLSVK